MLLNAKESVLLIVDIQEKLIKHIHEHESLIEATKWVINVAKDLDVPIVCCEQYPKGLGQTVAAIRDEIPGIEPIEKVHFSAGVVDACLAELNAHHRSRVVIVGIEAHVCVLQTAVDLLEHFEEVYVVAEGISSRSPRDLELALARLRDCGVQIVSKEMVFFEWLHQAGTELFKQMSKKHLQ